MRAAWFRGPADPSVAREAWDGLRSSTTATRLDTFGGITRTGEFVALSRSSGGPVDGGSKDRFFVRGNLESYELLPGDRLDGAGFIQFLTGRSSDIDRMLVVLAGMQHQMPKHRPDILGAHLAFAPDGFFVQTVFFTSEEEARRLEDREFSGGFRALFAEAMRLVEKLEFLDVPQPWIASEE